MLLLGLQPQQLPQVRDKTEAMDLIGKNHAALNFLFPSMPYLLHSLVSRGLSRPPHVLHWKDGSAARLDQPTWCPLAVRQTKQASKQAGSLIRAKLKHEQPYGEANLDYRLGGHHHSSRQLLRYTLPTDRYILCPAIALSSIRQGSRTCREGPVTATGKKTYNRMWMRQLPQQTSNQRQDAVSVQWWMYSRLKCSCICPTMPTAISADATRTWVASSAL